MSPSCVTQLPLMCASHQINLSIQGVPRWSYTPAEMRLFIHATTEKIAMQIEGKVNDKKNGVKMLMLKKKLHLVSLNLCPFCVRCNKVSTVGIRTNANLICSKQPTTLEKGLKSCHLAHTKAQKKSGLLNAICTHRHDSMRSPRRQMTEQCARKKMCRSFKLSEFHLTIEHFPFRFFSSLSML